MYPWGKRKNWQVIDSKIKEVSTFIFYIRGPAIDSYYLN